MRGCEQRFPAHQFRAAVPEVLDQRFPDGLKQRQKRMITRFGAADVQNIRPPIDVFQPQIVGGCLNPPLFGADEVTSS